MYLAEARCRLKYDKLNLVFCTTKINRNIYSIICRRYKMKNDATKRCMGALSADDGVVVAIDGLVSVSYLHVVVGGSLTCSANPIFELATSNTMQCWYEKGSPSER